MPGELAARDVLVGGQSAQLVDSKDSLFGDLPLALAIIAVAMSAAVRVAAVMTQSNGLLRDKSIALLAARSIEDLVAWSGGLYDPPAHFRDW